MPNNIKYNIRKYSEKEEKEIGVFISYKHVDESIFNEVVNNLTKNNVNVLSDKDIENTSDDFYLSIKEMLYKATCGLVILGDSISPWLAFELGYLQALNKKVYVYTKHNKHVPPILSSCILVDDLDKITEMVSKEVLFNDFMEFDTSTLSVNEFNERMKENTKYVELILPVKGISSIRAESYQFSCIIVSMYNQELREELGDICPINRRDKKLCQKYQENNFCQYLDDNYKNALDKRDIVGINKIYKAKSVIGDNVTFILPVNKRYGVTFKCFVDIVDPTMKEAIVDILMHNNFIRLKDSSSFKQNRFYFCLPENLNGVFELSRDNHIYNNYICPGILK